MAGHNEFVNETSFYNIMVLSHLLPASMWEPLPHFLQTWLRNYVVVTLLYFISGFLWCFYIYYLKLNVYVPKGQLTDPFVIPYWPGEGRKLSPTSYLSGSLTPIVILYSIPTKKAMLVQIYVAMKAIPMYTLLPAITEYMIERGWTQCYSTADQVNWFLCVLYIVLYLAFLEFAAYWVHKEFHENKFLYKHFHAVHHIYNKNDTISPFAGFAFHPMEGILQALPQVIALFVVPIHLRTLIVLLFLDGIFTTNIHDCIHGNVWPIMGAGYHTLHHTTYKHNYGHYTIWMDLMFGSLKTPVAEENSVKEKAK